MTDGPITPLAQWLHETKYRAPGEPFRDYANRVASALQDSDAHFHVLRDILLEQRFLPAGRIQSAIGSNRAVTPYNCFVSGPIADSLTAGPGSIMQRASEAAETLRMGGGIGYDFSTLRPRGSLIVSLESQSSGPVSFMAVYDAVCKTISSAGHRRGAQMGVLRVDHPDIEEFVHAKQNSHNLTAFNISVGVTDEFMLAVQNNDEFSLRFNGVEHRRIDARTLWEQIMRSTWDWAEPGVLFLDAINRKNNLWYCEDITATNPCSEQPLPPYGACLLGSWNLVKYIDERAGIRYFNFAKLEADIEPVVRAMDNVIDVARYPLPEQEAEAKSKRRMGLGVTGLANAGEALGFPYGSPAFVAFTDRVLSFIANRTYQASSNLAVEKGAFPLYDRLQYAESLFVCFLPDYVRDLIERQGIRNSHLLSIAPTGTISLCADNVASGIEPVFSLEYERIIQTFDGPQQHTVKDYGWERFGVRGKLAAECSADDHLNVLLCAQRHVDSAVSKTCNVNPNMPWNEFKDIYWKAWQGGAKGCTTFNPHGKRSGILQAGEACYIDAETGAKLCD